MVPPAPPLWVDISRAASLTQKKIARHVGTEHRGEMRIVRVKDGARLPDHAGVIDQTIEPAELFHRRTKQTGDVFAPGHISLDGNRPPAALAFAMVSSAAAALAR